MTLVGESTAIWVGNHLLYLDSNDVINVIPSGDVDKETAGLIKEAFLKLLDSTDNKVKILANLKEGGKPSFEARRVAIEIFSKDQVEMVAFFGLNPVARIIASFVINISQKKEISFFRTKEEALKWLNR